MTNTTTRLESLTTTRIQYLVLHAISVLQGRETAEGHTPAGNKSQEWFVCLSDEPPGAAHTGNK